MKVIGLTGGIGSGKTCVAGFLEELGAVIIDSDRLGHEVYKPGTPGWIEIVDVFGRDILNSEGKIDRKKLAQKALSNPEDHQKLNQILHPKIRHEVESRLNEYRQQGVNVAVVEAALLIEAGWMDMLDELWLVVAAQELALKRLEGRGLPEAEALARMARQTPIEEKMPYATAVINNNGDLDELEAKVEKLWNELHNR